MSEDMVNTRDRARKRLTIKQGRARQLVALTATALTATAGVGIAQAASPHSHPAGHAGTQATTRNAGYDRTVCNTPSNGVALRQSPSNTGTVIRQMTNGVGFHVYRTHASQPSIPDGWALGYVIGGGTGDDGYTKQAYLCP